MKFVHLELLTLIILCIFYLISIPLTIYWLINYNFIANSRKPNGARHKCITSRHFKTTWGYLISCIYSSNIGHPLSIILYYLHSNISQSTIVYSYLLSDISTFLVSYMCLIRAYMIMWDKKYNLARKEQFWTKKIVNDELETFGSGSLNDDDHTLSIYIKYRTTFGNVKYISYFILFFAAPITIFFILSPFIFNININYQLSSIFRFVVTIPITVSLVIIYFNIPKYTETIGLKKEIRAIVQIICGTFVASNILVSFLLFELTMIINKRLLMLINGNIQIISAFLLFYASTGFMLPKLKKIINEDVLIPNTPNTPITNTTNQRNRIRINMMMKKKKKKTMLNLVGTTSNNLQKSNYAPSTPIDPTMHLRKTITIWRRRKDIHHHTHHHSRNQSNHHNHNKQQQPTNTATNTATNTTTKSTPIQTQKIINDNDDEDEDDDDDINDINDNDVSPPYHATTIDNENESSFDALPPQYHNKMQQNNSETFLTQNRMLTFSKKEKSAETNHVRFGTLTNITNPMNNKDPLYSPRSINMITLLIQQTRSDTNLNQQKQSGNNNNIKSQDITSLNNNIINRDRSRSNTDGTRKNSTDRKFEIVNDNTPIDEDDEKFDDHFGDNSNDPINHHDDDDDDDDDDEDEEDQEVAVNDDVILNDDMSHNIFGDAILSVDDMEATKTIYCHNKHITNTSTTTTNTFLPGSSGSAGLITPQISGINISRTNSRHSRAASSKIGASEIMNLRLQIHHNEQQISNTVTFSNTTGTGNNSKRSSKLYNNTYNNTPISTLGGNTTPIIDTGLNLNDKISATATTTMNVSNTNTNTATPVMESENKSLKLSNNPSKSGRRHSLRDAYDVIKGKIGSYTKYNNSSRNSMVNNNEPYDGEEKVYFDHTIDDPLHVVLSDEIGLSHFADHLCSEFSIENLLFIVEALQYRYCIPLYLFDDLDGDGNKSQIEMDIDYENSDGGDINKENKSESCHLLMHIINQNKKLPISKSLKQHRVLCIELNRNKNNYNNNKSITNSPSRTISSPDKVEGVDFVVNNNHNHNNNNNNNNNNDSSLSAIRRRSQRDKHQSRCCKACTVEKFKYIIEKYVQTTSINLPSAIQSKLVYIWNELQIKDPEKRFLKRNTDKKKKKEKETEIFKSERDKTDINNNNNGDRENSKSESKSRRGRIMPILSIKRKPSLSIKARRSNTPLTPKRHSVCNDEEELSKLEEEEEEFEDEEKEKYDQKQILSQSPKMRTGIKKFKKGIFNKQKSMEDIAGEMLSKRIVPRQTTNSNTAYSNDSNTNNHSNGNEHTEHTENIEHTDHTKEQIPSLSVSPRDAIIPTNIDVNTTNTDRMGGIRGIGTTTMDDDDGRTSYSQNDITQSHHNHTSQISTELSQDTDNNNNLSHITTTPITNHTSSGTESNKTTPTENEEEPQPNTPKLVQQQQEKQQSSIEMFIKDNDNGMAPTDSMQEMKGNGPLTPTIYDENDENHEDEDKKEKQQQEEEENKYNKKENDEEYRDNGINHDGFGNINYVTVFDDAVLEIMKLIKADTWRRFKRSQQFLEWANDFKPS